MAVVVALLAEPLLPTLEDLGLNPATCILNENLFYVICNGKANIME